MVLQNVTNFHTTIRDMSVTILNEKNTLTTRMSVVASAITRWSPVQLQFHERWQFWCVQSAHARIAI